MFEWDDDKRSKNLAKHNLDFADARSVFDGRASIAAASRYPGELRFVTTAMMGDKFYSVVWTMRDENRRLISFRRARDGEEKAYRQIHG